jgi:hypothetical protein
MRVTRFEAKDVGYLCTPTLNCRDLSSTVEVVEHETSINTIIK